MVTEVEIAWAAGLFEGEGCVLLGKKTWKRKDGSLGRPAIVPSMKINMTDLDVLEKFFRIVGVGSLDRFGFDASGGTKRQYMWRVNGKEVETVARMLYPHLCARRKARLDEVWNQYREYIKEAKADGRGKRHSEVPTPLGV